nr:MAG TPA: hypothetical protein [Bacteriophage sp.]
MVIRCQMMKEKVLKNSYKIMLNVKKGTNLVPFFI